MLPCGFSSVLFSVISPGAEKMTNRSSGKLLTSSDHCSNVRCPPGVPALILMPVQDSDGSASKNEAISGETGICGMYGRDGCCGELLITPMSARFLVDS